MNREEKITKLHEEIIHNEKKIAKLNAVEIRLNRELDLFRKELSKLNNQKANKAFKDNMRRNLKLDKEFGPERLKDIVG